MHKKSKTLEFGGIKIKEKNCKGLNKAKGYGCGELSLYRTYGLCQNCYHDWLRNTPEGQEKLYKQAISYVKEIRKDKKAEKQRKKVEILSVDNYRKAYIQPKINKAIRLIDYGCPCIATGAIDGKFDAGHRISVGSNRTIALNAHNIFIQSVHSNRHKHGDSRRFDEGLKNTFGEEYFDFVCSLKSIQPLKLGKSRLIEINQILIDFLKELEPKKRNKVERIMMRDELNKTLSIYSVGCNFFK